MLSWIIKNKLLALLGGAIAVGVPIVASRRSIELRQEQQKQRQEQEKRAKDAANIRETARLAVAKTMKSIAPKINAAELALLEAMKQLASHLGIVSTPFLQLVDAAIKDTLPVQ